ncbi:MAG: tRNA pseudouridine(55) synthase TruB [Peptococcaceae bacterium]|jgi:tRNA pseudouridine55 synthase|nr:tRNA pseudouridine(55) synthase TruB [Peptococcaceae bacterium]
MTIQEINGFINMIKPAGLTSFAVVAKVRRALGMKRVGHGGTLDPEVTGVLPIALGKATRLCEYLEGAGKKYLVTIYMGRETDTQDATGETLKEMDCSHISYEMFLVVLNRFLGEIEQIPPMVSAVKQQGVPLYKLARKGIEVERKAKRITIKEITPIEAQWQGAHPTATFAVACSKGSYMRTLCHDIGEKLGVCACMEKLVRVEAGGFSIENGIGLDDFLAAVEAGDRSAILPMEQVVGHLPRLTVNQAEMERILHGNMIPWQGKIEHYEEDPNQEYMIYGESGKLIACGSLQCHEEQAGLWLKVRKVLA